MLKFNTTYKQADYKRAYPHGRAAGERGVSLSDNPHPPGTWAFIGWKDGHYDAWSAKVQAAGASHLVGASAAMNPESNHVLSVG